MKYLRFTARAVARLIAWSLHPFKRILEDHDTYIAENGPDPTMWG